MPSKGSPKLVVRAPEDILAALDARAEAEGVTRSDVVRAALERHLGLAGESSDAE